MIYPGSQRIRGKACGCGINICFSLNNTTFRQQRSIMPSVHAHTVCLYLKSSTALLLIGTGKLITGVVTVASP